MVVRLELREGNEIDLEKSNGGEGESREKRGNVIMEGRER